MMAERDFYQLLERQEVYIVRMKHIAMAPLITCMLLFTSAQAGSDLSAGEASKKDMAVEIPAAYDCVVVSKIGESTPIKDLSQASRGVFRFFPEGGTGRSIAANFKEQRSIQFLSADSYLAFVNIKLTDRNGKEFQGAIENSLIAGWSQLGADLADWTAMPHNLRVIYMR